MMILARALLERMLCVEPEWCCVLWNFCTTDHSLSSSLYVRIGYNQYPSWMNGTANGESLNGWILVSLLPFVTKTKSHF